MKMNKLKKLLALITITLVASASALSTKAEAAWIQSDNGNWSYADRDNTTLGWKSIDGSWYFFDTDGIMKTSWLNYNGSWYYLTSSGEMKTSWVNDSGKWYYTSASGVMKTGWVNDNGTWYYLNSSGVMQTGLTAINGKNYYLSESGAMKTGDITINGVKHTFAANGEEVNSSSDSKADTSKASTAASPTAATSSNSDQAASSSSGSSGGSSGGSGSNSSTSYYKSLYGAWSLGNCVSSKMTDGDLKTSDINDLMDKYGVSSITLSSSGVNVAGILVSDVKTKEGTMTAAEFKNKYNNVSFSDVGISGDKVKYINVSKSNYSGTIFIADNGDVYGLYKNLLYKLEK